MGLAAMPALIVFRQVRPIFSAAFGFKINTMRLNYLFSFLLMLCFGSLAHAQSTEGLTQDEKGRYIYSHTVTLVDAPKAVLYERLKSFVVEDLDASDTYIRWDEASRDSITTVAFIELGNSPDVINQIVDCKAKLFFTDGSVSLVLSGFNYSGQRADRKASYGTPLHRMAGVPATAQSWAKIALTETLRQLSVKMDQLASGGGEKPAKRRAVKARK